jgi:hypothetical protein
LVPKHVIHIPGFPMTSHVMFVWDQPPYLWANISQNSLKAVSGMARPQGRWLAAVFYPLGYPTPYGPATPQCSRYLKISISSPFQNTTNAQYVLFNWNFPCQTLKISKVSGMVMGSSRYALRITIPGRPGAGRPSGVMGFFFSNYQLVIVISNIVQIDTESSCRFMRTSFFSRFHVIDSERIHFPLFTFSVSPSSQARMGKGIHGYLKVSWGTRHARPLCALGAGHPPNGLTAVWGVAHPQGGRRAAVFFPLGYPFSYGSASSTVFQVGSRGSWESNSIFTVWVANPWAAVRLARGWPPAGCRLKSGGGMAGPEVYGNFP